MVHGSSSQLSYGWRNGAADCARIKGNLIPDIYVILVTKIVVLVSRSKLLELSL